MYTTLNEEQAKQFDKKIQIRLHNLVSKHIKNAICSTKEAELLLSKMNKFDVPHFYIIWKIKKNQIVVRPIVAGYNWILTPASIFIGHYLKEFCNKFNSILLDTKFSKIADKRKNQ